MVTTTPGWSQSPEGALIEPVDGDDLAYTYHIYPGHEASQLRNWEDSVNNGHGVEGVYEEYPLFVTEFGWRDYPDDLLGGTTGRFGLPFLEWLESHDAIHWTAWVADAFWEPAMFEATFQGAEADFRPYGTAVPEHCPDRPCEWALRGRDAGSDADMGEFVRRSLEVEGVPEGDWSDDATPGFGAGAAATGLAGGVATLLRRALGSDPTSSANPEPTTGSGEPPDAPGADEAGD